jgi:hypothetical protein
VIPSSFLATLCTVVSYAFSNFFPDMEPQGYKWGLLKPNGNLLRILLNYAFCCREVHILSVFFRKMLLQAKAVSGIIQLLAWLTFRYQVCFLLWIASIRPSVHQ